MAGTADDLQQVDLFSTLSRRQLKSLASNFRERRFASGQEIVREGAMSGIGFFVIADGEAKVSVRGRKVASIGPGDYFGEFALINEGERTATVTAQTDVRCLEIPFPDFRKFARSNPDVTWKLLQHVASLVQPRKPGR
jgi:CRP/FNR family transcriptional regulator, cyclic AMP receptor protein